jgi:hypothetical protein
MNGNKRTGIVTIYDFDEGFIRSLGGVLDVNDQTYYLEEGNFRVPIYFENPEAVLRMKKIPVVVIARSMEYDPPRFHSISYEYQIPADGSQQVPVYDPLTGRLLGYVPDYYETKFSAYPVDFLYDVNLFFRKKKDLVEFLNMKILKTLQPVSIFNYVEVIDSERETRLYECFLETINFNTELIDIAEKVEGATITYRVKGELDLNNPVVFKSFEKVIVDFTQK